MKLEHDNETLTIPVDLSRKEIATLLDLVQQVRSYQESGLGVTLPDLTSPSDEDDIAEVLRTALTTYDACAPSEPMGDSRDQIIQIAVDQYARPSSDDIEIDDAPNLSVTDDGCWVSAWVWVSAVEYGGDTAESEEN